MATSSLSTLFVLLLALALVSARYRYYYPKPSYRDMCAKVKQLEEMVNSLKQPIHVHVNGNNDEASLSADGTHIHVHVGTDNQQQALTARTPADDEYSYASCYVQPNPVGSSSVQGFVHLRQRPASQIEVKTVLSGFPSAGQYGFHVHEVSDYQNGCNSFGGHYNPYGKVHGGPLDTVRHVGDWGNLQVDDDGRNEITTTDRMASLFGTDSIVGRGIVIHAGVDDLGRGGNEGSLKTGNAGARLACCVIGLTKGGPW